MCKMRKLKAHCSRKNLNGAIAACDKKLLCFVMKIARATEVKTASHFLMSCLCDALHAFADKMQSSLQQSDASLRHIKILRGIH